MLCAAYPLVDELRSKTLWSARQRRRLFPPSDRVLTVVRGHDVPCCITPPLADPAAPLCSHPIISPFGIPNVVIRFKILQPILVSTLCDASRLARIDGPMIVLYRENVVSTLARLL